MFEHKEPEFLFSIQGYYQDNPDETVGYLFKTLEERKAWLIANRGHFVTTATQDVPLFDTSDIASALAVFKDPQ